MKGGRHIRYDQPVPLANLHLSLLDKVGVKIDRFGDSTGKITDLFTVRCMIGSRPRLRSACAVLLARALSTVGSDASLRRFAGGGAGVGLGANATSPRR